MYLPSLKIMILTVSAKCSLTTNVICLPTMCTGSDQSIIKCFYGHVQATNYLHLSKVSRRLSLANSTDSSSLSSSNRKERPVIPVCRKPVTAVAMNAKAIVGLSRFSQASRCGHLGNIGVHRERNSSHTGSRVMFLSYCRLGPAEVFPLSAGATQRVKNLVFLNRTT